MDWLMPYLPSANAIIALATLGTFLATAGTWVLMYLRHRDDALRGSIPTVSHIINLHEFVWIHQYNDYSYENQVRKINEDRKESYYILEINSYLDSPPHWRLTEIKIIDQKKLAEYNQPVFIDQQSIRGGRIEDAMRKKERPNWFEYLGLRFSYRGTWGGALILAPGKPMTRRYYLTEVQSLDAPITVEMTWQSMGYPPRTLRPILQVDFKAAH